MSDRVALIELFQLTTGKYWYQKWNWDSNEGYRQWYGINIDAAGHVESIHLRENNLRGSISDFHSIALLVNLRSLSLYSNSLSDNLPLEIGRCSLLREINLSWNQFSGELPDSIYDLKELRVLILDHNALSGELSERLGDLKELRILHLSHNRFSGLIPLVAHQLEYLNNIDLSHNEFTGVVPSSVREFKEISRKAVDG